MARSCRKPLLRHSGLRDSEWQMGNDKRSGRSLLQASLNYSMVRSTKPESARELAGKRPPKRRSFLKTSLLTAAGLVFLQWPVMAGQLAGTPGEIYPQGDVFCFTFYLTSEKDSAYALKNGATAIGPFYGDQAGALRLAERLNTKLLYKVRPQAMAGWGPTNKQFVWPSD